MEKTSLFSKVWRKLCGGQISGQIEGVVPKDRIAAFLPGSPVIVEAGAHIGEDTVELANQFPRGTVHAFEPVPELFNQLKARTAGLRNVRCYPVAINVHSGKAKMFISSGGSDGSSSLLSPKEHLNDHPEVLFSEEIEVECICLDEWAGINQVPKVDFLWLDLQGHEMNVLKASPRVLKNVQVIYSEVQLKEAYVDAPVYSVYRDWLKTEGFRVQQEEIPWEDSGNVLFVRQTSKG